MDNTLLWQSFALLNRRGQAIITSACGNMELSYSEYVILMRLFESEGRTQDNLAALLSLDKAVITRIVNELEKKSLVRRERDSRDKRVRHLYTTDLAKALEPKLREVLDNLLEYLFANLAENEREILYKGVLSAMERAAKLTPRNFATVARTGI